MIRKSQMIRFVRILPRNLESLRRHLCFSFMEERMTLSRKLQRQPKLFKMNKNSKNLKKKVFSKNGKES